MNILLNDDKIDQFKNIFNGSKKHRGRWSEKANSLVTMPEPFNFNDHLSGQCDQGISPVQIINGEAFAQYYCCDLDFGYQNLKTQKEVVKACNEYDPNLVVFKSKAKGYHVAGFENKLIEANELKQKAKKLEKYLIKKFDTDKKVVDRGKTVPTSWNIETDSSGAWLRMPYFKMTERKAISKDGYKELSFNEFLTMAKYKDHVYLSAICGLEKGEDTHKKLFWAAGYIKHYLNDDKEIWKDIYKAIGYEEADETNSQKLIHQWNSREKYEKEYFDNGVKGILKKEFHISGTVETELETKKDLVINIFNADLPLTKRDYYMDKYLMKGKLTLLQGMGGAGKSTLICHLAYCFSSGQSFFSNEIKETGDSLIVFCEEETNEINLKLKAYESLLGKLSKHKIHTIGYDQNLKLTIFKKDGTTKKTTQYELLDQYIKDHNIKFIGLDPLISLQLGSFDENSNPQMDSFMKDYLIPLAANNDCCLVAAHHTNKISMLTDNEISENSLYSGRGASSLGAAARIVIGVAKK